MSSNRFFQCLLIIALFFGVGVLEAQEKKYITYKVKEGESIESIAKSLSVTPYDLLKLNPDVKDNVKADDLIVIPNKGYDPLDNVTSEELSQIGPRDIVVDNFIYHEVVPKETVFSLLQKYQITEEELNKNNTFLARNGLKVGQVIKIPLLIDLEAIEEKEKNTQPYLVKAKETKYSISRQFGISIEYLEQLNPKIAEQGLQIDDVILVPKEVVKTSDEDFTVHKVEKLETMFSLTNMYGISSEELIEANPELADGVKEGMLLKIPNQVKAEKALFEDFIDPDKRLKVALMLPFKAGRDSLDFKNDRLLNITSDFYFGAMIALDSLKKQGLSVHAVVYDTENDARVSERLARRPEMKEFDAVIGPLFLSNLQRVSRNLESNGPLLVSPISSKDHSNMGNLNLVQEKASIDQLTDEMMEYIKRTHENQNLIIIKNSTDKSQHIYERIRKDIDELVQAEEEVIVMEPKDGYIDPELFRVFRDTLDRGIVNWFLVTDDEPAFLGDVFNNLGVFPEVDSLVVFGFEKSRNYNKIDNNFLARVHFHYPTSILVDSDNETYKSFESMYRKKYHTLPSDYSIEGFDVTYDLLMRLSFNSDLIGQGKSQRLGTRFSYIENTSGSILNNGIYLVKYNGLELEVIDESELSDSSLQGEMP
jgi:LysM repeat protein